MAKRRRFEVPDELRPLRGVVKRKDFLALDIESKDGSSRTRPGFTRPFLCGTFDGERYREFRDTDPLQGDWKRRYYSPGGCVSLMMRSILVPANEGKIIYAHNAGRFDYLFFLPWLMDEGERLGFEFQVTPVASSIQILKVWKQTSGGRMEWTFLDSFKLVPTALDKAAKAFGLDGKLEHDLSLHEDDPRWSAYLKQDCVVEYRVMQRFHEYVIETLGGDVASTAPATAIKLFRRKYLQQPVPRHTDTHEFIRSGYCGGRVEVFKSEAENLRYYDINSSYPASMLETMPVGQKFEANGKPPNWMLEDCVGFVEAWVHVPEGVIVPPLPIRCVKGQSEYKHLDGKLIFPVGRLHSVWEWGELKRALELGVTIERWGKSVWYEADYLFGEFVTDLYRYRDKNHPDYDPALAQVVKILLNASYGKFAMKQLRKQIFRYDDPDLPDEAYPADTGPDSLIWYHEQLVDAAYIIPQISARITALSRVKLLDGMVSTHELGGELAYCDTDSLLNDVEMETSTELGGWKDEYPEYSGEIRGRFLAPKLYTLTHAASGFELVKAKGFEHRTVEVLEDLIRGNTIVQRRLEKVGTLARRGFRAGPRMMPVPKSIKLDAGKRELLPDGRTKPWKLNMF